MNKFKIFSISAVGLSALHLAYDRSDSIRTYAKQVEAKKELVGVILIGRHGARTPFKDNLIPTLEEVRKLILLLKKVFLMQTFKYKG